jgi:hypothetical protein
LRRHERPIVIRAPAGAALVRHGEPLLPDVQEHATFPVSKHQKESDMAIVLTDRGEFTIGATNGLFVSPVDAEIVTGWTMKPEGMCRDELCVPLTDNARPDGKVDLATFWRALGHPVVSDPPGDVWVLGTAAESRAAALSGLEAPEFTLPDLGGVPHALSELRGKKVFLTTWASW